MGTNDLPGPVVPERPPEDQSLAVTRLPHSSHLKPHVKRAILAKKFSNFR